MPWQVFGYSAAVLAATAAIFEKWLLRRMSVWQMSAWFSLITALLVVPILMTFKSSLLSLSGLFWAVILLKAMMEALQFASVMTGIRRLGISVALPLMALSPAFVALAATLIIHDPLRGKQWSGLLFMVIGMYVIQLEAGCPWWRPFVRLFSDRSQWVMVLALAASVAAALLDKTILSGFKIPAPILLTVQQLYLAGLFLLILAVRMALRKEEPMPWEGSTILALLALAVVTIGYRYFQIRGIMLAPVALVLAVRRTSVVMATLAGGALFQEKGFLRRSLAATLLVVGAIWLSQNV